VTILTTPLILSALTVAQEPLAPVPFHAVAVEDSFWGPRIETNRRVTIPAAYARCEETGRLSNFAVAGGLVEGSHQGRLYNDSDVYKWIEGAAKSLHLVPDPELEAQVTELAGWIAAAQEEDGYLDTYYTLVAPDQRWTNLAHGHELYCAGHLTEAAIAWQRATGRTDLLDVALACLERIEREFGPEGRLAAPGHQEIELALLQLAEHLGEPRWRALAERFLFARGNPARSEHYGAYSQDHLPVLEQREATGHAVRATYQYCAMADVARGGGGPEWKTTLRALWQDVTVGKMYVTGGIGNSAHNEGFTRPFDLPNDSAYCETCASVGMALWAHRMLLLTGEAHFADVLELQLYNNFLSGVALAGDRFFYVNPLSSDGGHERVPWFDCSCCPVNVVRTLPGVGGMVYATRRNELTVALYVGGSARVELGGAAVSVTQRHGWPWSGRIQLEVDAREAQELSLRLRRPGWCVERPTLQVDGLAADPGGEPGSWIQVPLSGGRVHAIQLDLPLVPRRERADPRVEACRGHVALARGPIVYCLEGVDHEGLAASLVLPPESTLSSRWDPARLGGAQVILARGRERVRVAGAPGLSERSLTAIPYALWANRGPSSMVVWIPEDPRLALLTGEEGAEWQEGRRIRASHCWTTDTILALNDGRLPESSADHSIPRHTFWDHRGSVEWLEYAWEEPRTLAATRVYWFDDTGIGNCRVPASWRLLHRDGEAWRAVEPTEGGYGTAPDRLHRLRFAPVTTEAVRLEVRLQEGWSAGVLEWEIE